MTSDGWPIALVVASRLCDSSCFAVADGVQTLRVDPCLCFRARCTGCPLEGYLAMQLRAVLAHRSFSCLRGIGDTQRARSYRNARMRQRGLRFALAYRLFCLISREGSPA